MNNHLIGYVTLHKTQVVYKLFGFPENDVCSHLDTNKSINITSLRIHDTHEIDSQTISRIHCVRLLRVSIN